MIAPCCLWCNLALSFKSLSKQAWQKKEIKQFIKLQNTTHPNTGTPITWHQLWKKQGNQSLNTYVQHCLISTSWLTGLLAIFKLLHIWQNDVCWWNFISEDTWWQLSQNHASYYNSILNIVKVEKPRLVYCATSSGLQLVTSSRIACTSSFLTKDKRFVTKYKTFLLVLVNGLTSFLSPKQQDFLGVFKRWHLIGVRPIYKEQGGTPVT